MWRAGFGEAVGCTCGEITWLLEAAELFRLAEIPPAMESRDFGPFLIFQFPAHMMPPWSVHFQAATIIFAPNAKARTAAPVPPFPLGIP